MKHILSFLTVLILIVGTASYFYFYSGQDYYTKITSTGESFVTKVDGSEKEITDVSYHQVAFDKNGKEKAVDFNSTLGRDLRIGAYLKLTVNRNKGVLSWEEVTYEDLPASVKSQLN